VSGLVEVVATGIGYIEIPAAVGISIEVRADRRHPARSLGLRQRILKSALVPPVSADDPRQHIAVQHPVGPQRLPEAVAVAQLGLPVLLAA
jgi:hypothetical protein